MCCYYLFHQRLHHPQHSFHAGCVHLPAKQARKLWAFYIAHFHVTASVCKLHCPDTVSALHKVKRPAGESQGSSGTLEVDLSMPSDSLAVHALKLFCTTAPPQDLSAPDLDALEADRVL